MSSCKLHKSPGAVGIGQAEGCEVLLPELHTSLDSSHVRGEHTEETHYRKS